MAKDAENVCYHEKSQIEAKMEVKIPHKTSFYKDKTNGFIYCGICEKRFAGTSFGKEFARLTESKRQYMYSRIEYKGNINPLRHNQKVTDEDLEEEFGNIKNKYIKVSDLKFLFAPSTKYPEGFVKVNDSDHTTTVISSSYMRRLSKITQKMWKQKRAAGENKVPLVIFKETKERYVPRRKKTKEDKQKEFETKLKLELELDNSLNELYYAKLGVTKDFEPRYMNDDNEQKEEVMRLSARINNLRSVLGLDKDVETGV